MQITIRICRGPVNGPGPMHTHMHMQAHVQAHVESSTNTIQIQYNTIKYNTNSLGILTFISIRLMINTTCGCGTSTTRTHAHTPRASAHMHTHAHTTRHIHPTHTSSLACFRFSTPSTPEEVAHPQAAVTVALASALGVLPPPPPHHAHTHHARSLAGFFRFDLQQLQQ